MRKPQTVPPAQIPADALLAAENVKMHFPLRGGLLRTVQGHVQAVDGVSLKLRKGETLAVVGESGCGKSTLARVLLRLLEPSGGRVYFMGHDMTSESRRAVRVRRRHLQMVFQDPMSSLDPRMTVKNIVSEPLVVHRDVRRQFGSNEELTRRVLELLDLVGLKKEHLNRFPHEFSGGQRQRINIARALALNPDVIILDEPTSALDVSVQAQILNLLMSLQTKLGLTYLFITHDLSVVYHIADRVAVMYAGKIVELGNTEDIFREPLHPYTKALISAAPVADPSVKAERIVLEGEVPSPTHPPPGCRFHPRCWLAFEPCRTKEPPLFAAGHGRFTACFATARDLGLEDVGGPGAVNKKVQG